MPNERSFTSPSAIGLQMGASGQDVTVLQVFLRRFGYLQETRNSSFSAVRDLTVPDAATGTFDNATEEALRSYQQFHGLPVTGELDQATVAEMRKPRCGFPDRPSAIGSGRFVAQGNRWDHTNITYRIVNFTADLTQAEIRTAVRQAFDLWIAVVPLTFTEVTGSADILISFVTGDHGDGDPFDGMGNVLAHAYYPPPNGGDIAGDAHFDDAETWTVNVPVPAGGWDLITIAAHEFGHSLGLDHTNIANALMFPTFPPGSLHRFLAQDDIDGIQSIYGRRPQWQQFELAPAGSASTSGGITAVSRIPNSMEVWWVGANGSVQDAFWYEGGQWQQFELAPAGSASTSGGITAVSRIPNSMEVWWIGADGSVQGAFWYEGSQWQRYELAPAGSASTSGGITAVSRIPNSMEVWWVGANGSVQDAFWYEGGQWQQFELAPAGSASTSGGITAVSRIPNSMEVWWVGANGSVQDAFWYEGGQWQQFELAPAGSASTSGGITAVSRIPNSMEVWWVGAKGSVQDAFWYEGGQWQQFELAPAGSASTSGGITAVSRIPNSMEVWWIGADGSVQDAFWYEGGEWRRFTLASADNAPANGEITAVSRISNSMEVWWIGANGSVRDAYWYDS